MPPGNEEENWMPDARQPIGKNARKTFRSNLLGSRTLRRSAVPVLGFALLFAAIAVAFAYFTRPFSASGRLFAYEKTFANQAEAADFAASVTSTGSFAKVKGKLPRGISAEDFADQCQVTVDQGQPYVGVSVTAASAASARSLADVFTAHVAACADDWVSKRTKEVDKQISSAQRQLRDLRKQFGDFDDALLFADVRSLRQTLTKDAADRAASVASIQSQLAAVTTEEKKIVAALAADKPVLRSLQQELEQALTRYTEEHPRVKELRAAIIALQKESQAAGKSSLSRTNVQLAELNSRRSGLRDQLKKAEATELKSRQALQKFATNEVQFVRLQSEYNALSNRRDDLIQSRVLVGSKGVEKWRRSDRVELARVTSVPRLWNHGLSGAFAGLCVGSIAYAAGRRRHRVIRDEAALADVTGLPVLASLPDLSTLTDAARQYWAVETLQLLRNTAGAARRGSFVCGIISATNGEGRSTWIDLLADAGLRNGNRVLVISRPDCEDINQRADVPPDTLFLPQPVAETQSGSLARYALVGNVANITLQKNWERAFAAWQNEQNAVVLIELPSATTAEALLLSSAVPNVLWLAAANVAEAQTTVSCVNSLRNTGCNLIGAALNMSSPGKTRALAQVAMLAVLLACSSAMAQQPQPPAPPAPAVAARTNGVLIKSPPLAPWQQNLTLGPGDVMDISLYGQADSLRPATAIGPDGRFSYLQAVDVVATGLTVDQLRAQLESTLMAFIREPRVVIVPVAFQSKKYYVFGNVQVPGAYPLNTPVTVMEAVARARGFVTGSQRRSTFNYADLTQAFLVRRQANGSFAREPVDFESLFQRGELQHNKLLAPDDYLYFPPTGPAVVYVLGEVRGTGPMPYTKDLSALGAIVGRGGFTDGAFKQRILVVRGSLQKPETFIVNVSDVMRAAAPDFPLKPRDIVYVSRKPWAKAEELLEAASSDFVRAMTTTWTGQHIPTLSGSGSTPD